MAAPDGGGPDWPYRSPALGLPVTVKLRYPDFTIQSRAASAEFATDDEDEIIRLATQALDRALADRPPPVRLLGVSVSRLVPGAQLRLPPTPPA